MGKGNASGQLLQVGEVLNGKWVILEFVAKGGMGEVYRAHQLTLNRDVAIKIISHELIQELEDDEEELGNALRRFRNEVRAMSQVRHPNVLQIYDYDSFSILKSEKELSVEYIAMEFIPGRTLRSTMSDDGFYPEEGLTKEWVETYFIPVLAGVEALHNAHVIHRDIKPENVLLDGNIPKLADFGLARSTRLSPITQTIEVKGTPAYMSPEHLFNFRKADEQSDIYSLGKILYEAVAGRIPPQTMPFKKVSLENPTTPFFKSLDRVIQDATAEKKVERIKSASEFRQRLQEVLDAASGLVGEGGDTRDDTGRVRMKREAGKRSWIVIYAVVVLVTSALFWMLHYAVKTNRLFPHSQTSEKSRTRKLPPPVPVPSSGALPAILTAADGVSLHLIPAGKIVLPEGPDSQALKEFRIKQFYMDETPVTNYQYVTFLNSVLPDLKVEGATVKSDGQIWIHLGEILEDYEPIVFMNGEFQVNNSAHASCPVVRVTAYGAMAYARYYGRRLPTREEWLYVALAGKDGSPVSQKSTGGTVSTTGEPPGFPSPVILYKQNKFGIRGLEGPIGEWVFLDTPTSQFGIVGGFKEIREGAKKYPPVIQRYPWEAFEEIGFRCVQDIRRVKK